MDPTTHHALIVGIDNYPEFRALKGAEGDANDVEEWLKEIGVPAGNIKKLVSSQYTFNSVFHAKPIAQQIHDWLNDLDADAAARPGVDFPLGERVYVVFACHGYNAVTAQQTAIFPQTRTNYWDVIPLAPLRTYLETTAYFNEVVVIGDACRDQIDYAMDPIWPRKPDTHPNARRVQVFEAYGAKAGQKSKEIDFGGRTRGVLTQAFLHGVRGAAADDQGRVWAHRLESLIRFAVADKLGVELSPTIAAPRPPASMLICNSTQKLPRIILEPKNGATGTAVLKSQLDDSKVPVDLSVGRQEFLVPPGFYTVIAPAGDEKPFMAAWEETYVAV